MADVVEIPFAEYCARVQLHLEKDYGITVITRDIPDPLTGDLDGAQIHIDYSLTPEQRLFLLAHLFGHTVQWNVDPGAFELGRRYAPPVDEALYPAILVYEGEAASYGLSLLHEVGICDVDPWFSAYSLRSGLSPTFLSDREETGFSEFLAERCPVCEAKTDSQLQPNTANFPHGRCRDLNRSGRALARSAPETLPSGQPAMLESQSAPSPHISDTSGSCRGRCIYEHETRRAQ